MGRRAHADGDYLFILIDSRRWSVALLGQNPRHAKQMEVDNLIKVIHSAYFESTLSPPTMAHTDPTRIRTTISVDKDVHEIFVRMADTAGMSVSRCMGEWLSDTADGALFVAEKMAAARQAPMQVMREMQAMSKGMQDGVEETMRELRQAARQEAGATAPGGRPGRLGRGLIAPSSNTGLKETKKMPRGKKAA